MGKCFLLVAAASSLLLSSGAIAQTATLDSTTSFAPAADPALVSFVRAVLEQHPQVLAAGAGVDMSRALERAAGRPLFNPELELDFASSDTNDGTLRLTQTFDWAGQRSARADVAAREREGGERLLAISRRNVAVELLSALGTYWTAHELDTLATLRVELMQRFADVAVQRRRAGDLAQADLNLANLANAQAQIERAGAAAELAAADQTLLALFPSQTATWPHLSADLPEIRLTEQAATQLVADLPERHLQESVLAAASAEMTLRERQRRANPSFSLRGGDEEDESLIGLSFSIPLNVRNRFVHEVDAARAKQAQAEREIDNVTVRARAALLAATARYGLTRDAWNAWRETGAPNLSQQTELLERLWRAGELNLTDYLVQLDQTLDTQASALQLQRELWLAWFGWLAAAGQVGAWLVLPVEVL